MVATGGLSIPKMGATAFGYELARQFGLKIRETRPALVPLVLEQEIEPSIAIWPACRRKWSFPTDHQSFREKMLITHRGFERTGNPANLLLLE